MPPRSPTWKSKYSHVHSATYLSNLRENRPARPSGSRPAPFRIPHLTRSDSEPITQIEHGAQAASHPEVIKSHSYISPFSQRGRPIVNGPTAGTPTIRGRKVSPTVVVEQQPIASEYDEPVARKLEKEEAHTLREALNIIDQRGDEQRVYNAAQDEAADLVWKHRNPQAAEDEKTAPYFNPAFRKQKAYGTELSNAQQNTQRNVSESSTSSNDNKATKQSKRSSRTKDRVLSQALRDLHLASEERASNIIAHGTHDRRSSGKRVTSNGSSKGVFRNPEDQIYEEPESFASRHSTSQSLEQPLQARDRNSLPRGSRPLPEKPAGTLGQDKSRFNRVDIYKNTPTQSRNAAYTMNNTPPPTTRQDTIEEVDTPGSSSNLEIRSEDIRAATSMRKGDRSPKLPTPVAVSDHVGRPIVSFDPTWRPTGDSPRNSHDTSRPVIKLTESPRTSRDLKRPLPRPVPSINEPVNSAPVVPTINLPGEAPDVPSINIENGSMPMIAVSSPDDVEQEHQSAPKPAPRPLPRPLPRHAATTPTLSTMPSAKTSRPTWLSNAGLPNTTTVSCSSCNLPISGRVLTASGSATTNLKARFHPECFVCFQCSTALECTEFYPEPDNKRAERLEAEGLTTESTDAEVRFYCHLDYHELYSPRCKSCKTPIEGQVIIAAGSEWHPGHFFCGECGDPFDSETPFVERDGYAYCVRCHTKRTSARCRECKQLIQDELTVEALGGKWHEQCFVCFECGGGFGDDGRFFVRNVEVELSDKERRRGVGRKMDEKAVCQGCEERRLKA